MKKKKAQRLEKLTCVGDGAERLSLGGFELGEQQACDGCWEASCLSWGV